MRNNKFLKKSLPLLLVMMMLMSTVTSFAGSVILEEEIIEENEVVEESIEEEDNDVIEEEVVEPENFSAVRGGAETPADYFDTYNVRRGEISIRGFKRGKFTENLVIPEVINGRKVTEIASSAFRHEKIKTLVLPKNLWRVHGYAFANTDIERVILDGNDMDYVQPYSFAYMNELKEVVVDGNIKKIGGYAFTKNPNLENFLVTEDATVKSINDYAFARNEKLEAVQIHGKVGTIRTYAFAYNPKLVLVEILGEVNKILGYAFAYNANLGYVDIAGNIDQMNDYSFAYNGKGIAGSGGVVVPSPEPVEVEIKYEDENGPVSGLDHSIMATPTLEHMIFADENAVRDAGYYLAEKSSKEYEVKRFDKNEVVFKLIEEPSEPELTKYTIRHVVKDEEGKYHDILNRRVGEGKINIEGERKQGIRIHAKPEEINGYEFIGEIAKDYTILSKDESNTITFEYKQVDENPVVEDNFEYVTYREEYVDARGNEIKDTEYYPESIPGTTIFDVGRNLNYQQIIETSYRPQSTEIVKNPAENQNVIKFDYTVNTGNPSRINYVIRYVGNNKYGELVDIRNPRKGVNNETNIYISAEPVINFNDEEYEVVGDPFNIFRLVEQEINTFYVEYKNVEDFNIPKEEDLTPEIDEDDYIEDEVTIYHGMLNITGNIRQMRPYAFAYGDFQEVSITGNVDEIMSYAFKKNGLNNLELSDNIDTIRSYAFAYNDLEEVRIPKNVSRIQTYAFAYNNMNTLNYTKLSNPRVKLAHNMFRHQKTGNNVKVVVPAGVTLDKNDALMSVLARYNNISEIVYEGQ